MNTIVGPAITGLVDYPFSDTLRNETIGLELFAAVVLTPLLLWAAWLQRRQQVAAPVVALGPTAFVVYMFVQYIAGPGYAVYPAVLFPHLAIFVLAGALLVVAWSHARVPSISSPRRWATVLGLFTLFVLSRYVDAYVGTFTGAAVPESYTGDLGMFWTVVLLDLGVVVPVAVATVAALLRGTAWADRALYGVLGWFTLVPPAVATMALVKLVVGDPHGTVPLLVVLGSAAAVSVTVGVVRYRSLFTGVVDGR